MAPLSSEDNGDSLGCVALRARSAFLFPPNMPKPPNIAGLGTVEVMSLFLEFLESLDSELRSDEPRERPFVWESFLVLRCPLVSRVGSFHEISNILQ